VDLALVISAFMLGLAGMPHCAAMCGAPCAAVVGTGGAQGRSRALGFHFARVAGYATAGALVAGGVSLLALAGSAAPLVRPLWTLLHMAALALGLWLLITARQPAFMTNLGRTRQPATAAAGAWQAVQTPWTAAAAGSAWVAWPCGLLQSALVVAALANSAASGAAAMAAFAVASAGGLQAAPWIAGRLAGLSGASAGLAVRVAGLALAAGSGWALGHDIWGRVAAYCAT
jgi:sulfite exporter TauE/SafE